MQQKQQQPTMILSVCAPSDIPWLERWEAHLRPLEQAGILSAWSERHIHLGEHRLQRINNHLDQADLIVLLLSADFFADDECMALMERALTRYQQSTAQLIPLLLRPVSWRETPLANFAPLPSNGHFVTQWENYEVALDDCVRDLRRILSRPITKPLARQQKRASAKEIQQRPTTLFSVSAPPDMSLLRQWEAHLHPLEQAGILSIWSERHLPHATDRLPSLHGHLDHADFIVLLLSADFFADDECMALMERALTRYQQSTAQLIPLLLRPVPWRETPLANFAPLPSNGHFVTQWDNSDAAFDDCVRNLRRILGRPITAPLPSQRHRASVEEQNRARMRERLRRTYEDLFTQSLSGTTLIELGFVNKPDAVQNAATLLSRTSTHAERLLPPGTSILRVYDEAMYELLILGAPSVGKSTLLIELAQQLVVRADANEAHPLPIILPLSSWATKRPPLHIWLVEQVGQLYDIPKNIAQEWINHDQLLPLLDGLDEMKEATRPHCITAINVYHRDHPGVPLVVCSRQAEYEEATKQQRLALQMAVVVQPLTNKEQWVQEGNAYVSAQQYDEALQAYSIALRLDQSDGLLYYQRGCTFASLKRYNEAIADYERAISLSPQFASAYFSKGTALQQLGKSEQALGVFLQARQLGFIG